MTESLERDPARHGRAGDAGRPGRAGEGRAVEETIEIPATAERVWRALTDPEDLVRWFPLEARVEPGSGGSAWFSWGPPHEWDMQIALWEPPRRLRLVERHDRSVASGAGEAHASADGEARMGGGTAPALQPVRLAVDYLLEARGGKTVLRVVHSGFGPGKEWDDELDGTRRGWSFELRGLRHYLARHAGEPRRVVWARSRVAITEAEVWGRVLGPDGLRLDPATGLTGGDVYVMRPDGIEELGGRVEIIEPPLLFSGTVGALDDALLRVELEKGKVNQICVWLSTYGVVEERIHKLQEGLDALLARLFTRARAPAPAGSEWR